MIGLDTCTIIDLLDNKIADKFLDDSFAISVLVKYEFLVGADPQEAKLFEKIWQKAHQIEVTDSITNIAIKSQTIALKKGITIPLIVCLIGASYAQINAPVLTNNKKDFKEIQNLQVISY